MAIKHIELKDFLVFKGEFAADFCPGVNVLIGGNGTGKTTLMKSLYWWVQNHSYLDWESNPQHRNYFTGIEHYFGDAYDDTWGINEFSYKTENDSNELKGIYIPEKDILEHAKGLLPFMRQKQTGFNKIYEDILIASLDIPTVNQSEMQQSITRKLSNIIGGTVHWDDGRKFFYTEKKDGSKIPFAFEASGYKRLGFLWILVSGGYFESGSVLFWDEPENTLNPEIMPELVDILLELSRNGVQIFLATHSEIFASYFSANAKDTDEVLFTSLYKDGNQIKAHVSDLQDTPL